MPVQIDFAFLRGRVLDLPKAPNLVGALMVIQDECAFNTGIMKQVLDWCIRKECRHIAFVGACAESSHDIFDSLAEQIGFEVVTTWHVDEPPDETINFFLNYFNMDNTGSERFAVLLCGNGELQNKFITGLDGKL